MSPYQLFILAIEKQYGSKIESYNQVKNFAKHLEENHKINLSLSTLRRFFKTVPSKSLHSQNTLNRLSNYLNLSNYEQFLEKSYSYDSMRVQRIAASIKLANSISKNDISFISKELSSDIITLLVENIFQHALMNNKNKLQRQVFDLIENIVEVNHYPFLKENLALNLWQSLILANKKVFNDFIQQHASSPKFQNYVIFNYIDYDHLNTRYGRVLELIQHKSLEPHNKLFIKLMLSFRDYLNKKEIHTINNSHKNLPAILNGRLLIHNFLYDQQVDLETKNTTWRKLINKGKKIKNKNLFFIEVIHVLLVVKRVDLIDKVISTFYEELFEISDGFTYLNRSIYLLGESFVAIKKGKVKSAHSSMSLIHPSLIKNDSFNLWFKVFFLLVNYHATDDKLLKKNYLTDYTKVAKKLKFALFDTQFCTEYFNK